jgi:hypothetical protein
MAGGALGHGICEAYERHERHEHGKGLHKPTWIDGTFTHAA